jgi:glycosyltransferase involved in cell wall biosynthesis
MNPRVAVLIPCCNEAATIAKVVQDFRIAVPGAVIYVYDNNSTDHTAEAARAAGACVRQETLQGKGYVVRRMFRDIDADFYIVVDGDDTYDAAIAPQMLDLARCGQHDLVNSIRVTVEDAAYRGAHRWGNAMLTWVVRRMFGARVQDMLSGYKVFSRRFVKSFPALSQGFDIETELTIHALELTMSVSNVHGCYKQRLAGSESKLRTYHDGLRILIMIVRLVRHERPLLFFGTIAGLLAMMSIVLSIPLEVTYLRTGLVPRLPTAVLSTGIMLFAIFSFFAGMIVDTVTRGRREVRLLAYLQQKVFDPTEDGVTQAPILDQ